MIVHESTTNTRIRVSVIVPTRNSGRTLERCLRSARQQLLPGTEIIVVDNNSTDDTVAIAHRSADVVISAGSERSEQRNIGAAAARGDFLLFVDSDMVLDERVTQRIEEQFASAPHVSALVVPEYSFGSGFWAACRALEKRLYVGDPAVEAARAYRSEIFHAVGGYNMTITGAEDYQLPDRLVAVGNVIGRIDAPVWHDEGQIRLRELFRKKRYYGRWLRIWASDRHTAPRLRRTSLIAHPIVLLRDPVHAAGLVVLKTVDAVGLLIGMATSNTAHP
jgi:glycosyltransferase involved in cell wall biosynthesis